MLKIFEFGLSSKPRIIASTDTDINIPDVPDVFINPDNYSEAFHPVSSNYHISTELSIDRYTTNGSSTLLLHASAIAYIPEEPTTVSYTIKLMNR